MIKVHIATARPIGERCREWAMANMPAGSDLVGAKFVDECDVFISVMYDKLVSEEFIEKRRCYNFHPGLLPQYRGSGAFSWAIINGEKETGVTLHKLETGIDSGPILAQRKFPVGPEDTAHLLFLGAMEVMFAMFKETFSRLVLEPGQGRSEWIGEDQDESQAKVYYRRDLQQARDLTRFVRAFTFEGKPNAFYTKLDGTKVELTW